VLVVATIKATLVLSYFMHLKFDWTKVKILIIPAVVLSIFLVMALLPDITFALREPAGKSPPEAVSQSSTAGKTGH
jgi:hypothetical protein